MRLMTLLKRYTRSSHPKLRAVNPRLGTSIIPLEKGDELILFRYLMDKVHALHFEGSEDELEGFLQGMIAQQGISVQRMNFSWGRSSERLMHLHLRLQDQQEIRRVIHLQ